MKKWIWPVVWFWGVAIILAAGLGITGSPLVPYKYAQILLPSGDFVEGKLERCTRGTDGTWMVRVDGIEYCVSSINLAMMDRNPMEE